MKLATASQMQALDRRAIEEFGIPGIVLMENAGRGTLEFICHELGPVAGRTVVLFIGPGNNGGDALVIARHVHNRGGHPLLFFLVHPDSLRGDAGINVRIVQALDLPSEVVDDDTDPARMREIILHHHARNPVLVMIDGLFGTGLTREIQGRFARVIELINDLSRHAGWPVAAVDIPSGLHADTGQVLGTAVRADLTATYGVAKPAHFLNGAEAVGRLQVIDITIPSRVVAEAGLEGETVGPEIGRLLRPRTPATHKGTYGHLLIVAGSIGKTGAAILSALGGLHSGTGLVSLAVPHGLNPIFETALPEAMSIPLPGSETVPGYEDYDLILEATGGKSALVIGPGLGTDSRTRELVLHLYRDVTLPMVLDADALNILALEPHLIDNPPAPRILTPHPGEMARLTGLSTGAIQADRVGAATFFAGRAGQSEIITVLKGAGTMIGDSRGSWAVNTSGNPGMATGGMGDVLAGLIGGLLAQKYAPWDAARLGVYLHGLAADLLQDRKKVGFTASEVAAMLPEAMTELMAQTSH
ncbi:bifunctional NAD(P)H-hydrate repair enzyme [Desulfolithobacter dissulfuricans]|uniref:Bifunctional NAD(P)H-hydrate repair enzyme n=1 Tax=Desulfolithobacter dissulfuricans TaxID=2795293 RepID=A0A915U1H3_9BACT|nr:NAD(P)H-hydrate dehydratase [Desulfolithobacter dissulfuricans]BCO09120.1 bifunctional NAD(P)H-hydrate repair enzyme [Desulfolithobacter dissulfuricans]